MFDPRKHKEQLSELAQAHYLKMKFQYEPNTSDSIDRSKVYDWFDGVPDIKPRFPNMNILIEELDTTNAIFRYRPISLKLAALNFASFKKPGGMFLNGSNAQEEALCHTSNLYNILLAFAPTYYNQNKKMLNKSLYVDRAIYTPDVIFEDYAGVIYRADVITCAAPNKKSAQKYYRVSDDDVNNALVSRINHVLYTAYSEKVDTLILGAFGCGVFGNDPYEVATIFKYFLKTKYANCFEKVVFAIPGGKNFEAFIDIFNN